MKIYAMNGLLNGLSRINPEDVINGEANLFSYGDVVNWDDPEGYYSHDEVINGLSRIEVMTDQELSEELGKFRIRFGKGKGKKRRKERKHIRLTAKALKKQKKKDKRKAGIKGFGNWIKDVAGAFGGKGGAGGVAPEVQYRMLAEQPTTPEEYKIWGMTIPQLLGATVGVVVVIGGVRYLMKNRKKKR